MTQSAPTTGNAAIFFVGEAYDTSRPALLGRDVANAGLLEAWLRYAGVDSVYGFAPEGAESAGVGPTLLTQSKGAGSALS